ncbi:MULTISPECIES: hypothetical protein [Streptomyces]|uniref:ESX-1 secretion-associated protein n=1 Tax=Streptomyces cacaoi TaxID=1898 RepID=A0A4Y3RBT7_STRCI|nr:MULTISPECIES: hypothetical protein [Streptomyces]GEB54157.1 hypothetical protein SCA03_67080 [Streptomyces cacaoi]
MSFEQEWQDIKADTAATSPRMQLDGAVDGSFQPGRSSSSETRAPYDADHPGDLSVKGKDLAAIGDEAFKLHGRLLVDGDHARVSTGVAASSLKGDFELCDALEHVVERWTEQTRSVLDACAHISNHLDYTKKAHAGDEHYISTTFSKISELDSGFDEATQPQPHAPQGTGAAD